MIQTAEMTKTADLPKFGEQKGARDHASIDISPRSGVGNGTGLLPDEGVSSPTSTRSSSAKGGPKKSTLASGRWKQWIPKGDDANHAATRKDIGMMHGNYEEGLIAGANASGFEILKRHLRKAAFAYGGFNSFGVKKLFRQIDQDHGGTLDYEEFLHCVREMGELNIEDMPDEEVRRLFDSINLSRNGNITRVEFSRFLGEMISFDQRQCGGALMILDAVGSVYPKVWPFGLIAAFCALGSEALVYYANWTWLKTPCTDKYMYEIFTVLLGIFLVFRTQMSYARFWEGREQLQILGSKWGDAALQAVVFDLASRKEYGGKKHENEIRACRTRIVSMFSTLHGVALAELSDGDALNMPIIEGISTPEVTAITEHRNKYTRDRTYTIFLWIVQDLTNQVQSNGLNVPPPICSRLYQELSNGMLAFNNAMKIHDTPFPFPYSQIMATLLMLMATTVGPIFNMYLRDEGHFRPWLAMIFGFMCTCGYYALNEVAIQLEDPFGDDATDLPMQHYQYQFNCRLMLECMIDSKKFKGPGLNAEFEELYQDKSETFDNPPLHFDMVSEENGWKDICNIQQAMAPPPIPGKLDVKTVTTQRVQALRHLAEMRQRSGVVPKQMVYTDKLECVTQGLLELVFSHAENLHSVQKNGEDPYVLAVQVHKPIVGGMRHRGRTAQSYSGHTCPKWGHRRSTQERGKVILDLAGHPANLQAIKILVANGRQPLTHKVMGGCLMPLSELAIAPRRRVQHELELVKPKTGDAAGMLTFTSKFTPMCAVLVVWIKHATNLPISANSVMERLDRSDPYARVRMCGQEFKTKVLQNTSDPVWNERFIFLMEKPSDILEIEILDQDIAFDDLLATCKIPVLSACEEPSRRRLAVDSAIHRSFPMQTESENAEIELSLELFKNERDFQDVAQYLDELVSPNDESPDAIMTFNPVGEQGHVMIPPSRSPRHRVNSSYAHIESEGSPVWGSGSKLTSADVQGTKVHASPLLHSEAQSEVAMVGVQI